jgi:glycosidase
VKLAILLQMTLPGVPCIYYGDEIGLAGNRALGAPFRDCDSRRSFPWQQTDQWDYELLAFTKEATAMRHRYLSLRQGLFQELVVRRNFYSFSRSTGDETLVIAVNTSEEAANLALDQRSLPVGHVLRPVFGDAPPVPLGDDASWNLHIPSRTALVYSVD